MDEWLGILFIIGCFAMSFVMELRKKRKAMNEDLSEPVSLDPDVIELEQVHRGSPSDMTIPQRNKTTKKPIIKQTLSEQNKQGELTAEDPSLEEIKNAVIWSEILNRKYT